MFPLSGTTVDAVRRDPLPIASSSKVKAAELKFLNSFKFIEYDVRRDLNVAPMVMYSHTTEKYYVKNVNDDRDNDDDDDDGVCKNLMARDFERFTVDGHTLSVSYSRSYVRPFAVDLDCLCCHGNRTNTHLSELKANAVFDDVLMSLKQIDKRCVVSLWNLNCGFHIYSNVFVSIAAHEQIINFLKAKYAQDLELVLELPVFMPLPYSAKVEGHVYRQTLHNNVELDVLTVFCNDKHYTYHENCIMERDVTPSNFLIVETNARPCFLAIHQQINPIVDQIPNFTNARGVRYTDDGQAIVHKQMYDFISYVIIASKSIRNKEPGDYVGNDDNDRVAPKICLVNYDSLNEDRRFSSTIRRYREQVKEYLLKFNTLCFAEKEPVIIFDPSSCTIVRFVFDRFVEVSASYNGGLNVQHYVVALQKCLKPIDGTDFKHVVRRLYENVDDPSIRHFVKTYDPLIEHYYTFDYTNILTYLRLFVTDKILPSMNASDIFDTVMCTKLGVTTPDQFLDILNEQKTSKLQKSKISTFIKLMVDTCREYHFLQYYNNKLYAINDEMFFYDTMENVSFFMNWLDRNVTDSMIRNSLQAKSSKFNTDDFAKINEYMTNTSVGMFNTITGLYSTRTTLVPFLKGRFSVVWPMDRPLTSYDDQNNDILRMRETVRTVVNTMHNKADHMFVEFLFRPSLLSIRKKCISVNGSDIKDFFEKIEQHNTLPNTADLLEMFPFNRQFIVYILELLHLHGLDVMCNYKKLCQNVFNYSKRVRYVTKNDWLENFQQTFRAEFRTNDIDSELFTCNDPQASYYQRLSSFSCKCANISDIDERTAVIGITLAAVLCKCDYYENLCKAFNVHNSIESWMSSSSPSVRSYEHSNSVQEEDSDDDDDDDDSTVIKYHALYEENIKKLMTNVDDHFERKLYTMALQLCMSTNFKENATREVLNVYSTLMVPINVKKKIYVLFGEQNSGKSYILNILTELMKPSVDVLEDFEEAENRSGLASKKLLLRGNELKTLSPSTIKSITGNDPKSNKIFFSQKYDLTMCGQAAVFAATNVHVEFKENKTHQLVDRATIDRFHTIRLRGQQIHGNADNSNADSIFAMTASNQYFISSTVLDIRESANALQWLMYENYMITRDPLNYRPYIDEDFEDSIDYKRTMYRNNSVIYDFLSQCGICEESGFHIMSGTLMRIVSRDFASKDNASNMLSVSKNGNVVNSSRVTIHKNVFFKLFKTQYNIDLSYVRDIKINGLQIEELVNNIKENLKTEKHGDGVILESDLLRRLSVYINGTERDNAKIYFKRKNGNFRMIPVDNNESGSKRRTVKGIKGIRFVNPEMLDYAGERGDADDMDDMDDAGRAVATNNEAVDAGDRSRQQTSPLRSNHDSQSTSNNSDTNDRLGPFSIFRDAV